MLARDQRTPFSDWWWTVDKLLLGAIMALMLGGVILSLAASPPVATRIGLGRRIADGIGALGRAGPRHHPALAIAGERGLRQRSKQ